MTTPPLRAPSPAPGAAPGEVPGEVAVLLVCHDGERWLPGVLDALGALEAPVPTSVVVVDTGSTDAGPDLVRAAADAAPDGALAAVTVLPAVPGASFPDAVRAGLDHLDSRVTPPEWVWLLHDDAAPAPGALHVLLEAAAAHPEADLLGPTLREWPSLRRLLEVGVTISGTGRRERGLEQGEYDQGQHDEVREVLAVNTAGLLARRAALEELGGLEPALPVFGNDLDLGWRAAAAGRTTLVVPRAVVFHAEAAHRGLRRTPLTGARTHFAERRAALWTLLANSRGAFWPLQVVRLVLGTLLRALGLLLVRAPGPALDEVAAIASVLARPGELRAARRRRREARGGAEPDRARVRRLLAPPWLPYRHGLDALGDVAAALGEHAGDVAERRRLAAAERDPSSLAARRVAHDDERDDLDDPGLLTRVVTSPVALVLVLVVAGLLVAARAGLGTVVGGALSPAPDSAGRWWSLALESWHELGQGTAVPAPPGVLPLAVLGSVLTPTGAVSALMLLGAPLALASSWRLLGVVGRLVDPRGLSRWLLVLGATTYALVPLVSGAWGLGRLGVVVSAALLPLAAHAALGFADPDPDRRWRAAWRTGLLLSLVVAATPAAYALAVLLAVAAVPAALALGAGGTTLRSRSAWAPPLVALGVPPVLLCAWWVPALTQDAASGLLLDLGRPGAGDEAAGGASLVLGRLGDGAALGAPAWLGALLLLLAVLALVPGATRRAVLACWGVALAAALSALALSLVPLSLGASPVPADLGVLLVAWQGCLVLAAVLGGHGLVLALDGSRRVDGPRATGPRRTVTLAAAAAVALVVPLGGLAWAVVGAGDDLGEAGASDVPAYMVQSAMTGPEHGVLVLRGSLDDGLDYTVLRDDGTTLGEDQVLALAAEDDALTADVTALVSRPRPALVARLADAGVEYVVMPAPADGRVAAGLDATAGLTRASAEDRATRAWQVEAPLDADAVAGTGPSWRPALLVLQLVGLVVVLVLAAPTARRPTSATTSGRRVRG